MSGSRYSYAVTQLASQEVLNPDAHMFVQEDFYQAEPNIVAAVMTQLSLKSGLKELGNKAYIAAESEMKQLHFRNTFKPMHRKELTDTQRQTVLELAGGNIEWNYISKEDASLSTVVATESVLLLCIIDAEEGRDVTVIDIPNAFIQTVSALTATGTHRHTRIACPTCHMEVRDGNVNAEVTQHDPAVAARIVLPAVCTSHRLSSRNSNSTSCPVFRFCTDSSRFCTVLLLLL
jgi:hypothetical protein